MQLYLTAAPRQNSRLNRKSESITIIKENSSHLLYRYTAWHCSASDKASLVENDLIWMDGGLLVWTNRILQVTVKESGVKTASVSVTWLMDRVSIMFLFPRFIYALLSASQGLLSPLCRTSTSNAAKAELLKSSRTRITPVTTFSFYCHLAGATGAWWQKLRDWGGASSPRPSGS